ncbi:hypothetical protein V2J09_012302 [Rumex salicifolius]
MNGFWEGNCHVESTFVSKGSACFPPPASFYLPSLPLTLFLLFFFFFFFFFFSRISSSVKPFLLFTLYMDRGGFHGYHHKLPRMISSSVYQNTIDMTQQGLSNEHMMNGKQMPHGGDHHHPMMMSHGTSNGMITPHDHQLLNLNPNPNNNNNNNNGSNSNNGSKGNAAADDPNECMVREQDRFMPIANVIRIMRKTLPPHAKISDDAKETIQECVSEFISFITGEANERCQREQRKTITAEDVLWAMSKLGFDDYVDPLTLYLHRYRELEGDRGSIRGDPLVKRPYDFSSSSSPLGIQAPYPPVYHMAPPPNHPHGGAGYYGPMQPAPPPCNGCGSGQPGFEPYGQQNKGSALEDYMKSKCIIPYPKQGFDDEART